MERVTPDPQWSLGQWSSTENDRRWLVAPKPGGSHGKKRIGWSIDEADTLTSVGVRHATAPVPAADLDADGGGGGGGGGRRLGRVFRGRQTSAAGRRISGAGRDARERGGRFQAARRTVRRGCRPSA